MATVMRNKRENRLSANDIGVSSGGRESESVRASTKEDAGNVKRTPFVLGRGWHRYASPRWETGLRSVYTYLL